MKFILFIALILLYIQPSFASSSVYEENLKIEKGAQDDAQKIHGIAFILIIALPIIFIAICCIIPCCVAIIALMIFVVCFIKSRENNYKPEKEDARHEMPVIKV